MANPHKGEVSLDIDGTTYTLALTIDSMVALEEAFSTPTKEVTFQEVMAAADRGSIKHLRAFLWAALMDHHPTMTIKDISPLVQKAGGIAVITMKLMELAKESAADTQDLAVLGVNQNQKKAQGKKRGDGEPST
jgi:hypothetical protein